MSASLVVLTVGLAMLGAIALDAIPTAHAMTCQWATFRCEGDVCAAGAAPIPGGYVVGCAAADSWW